jgi:hypothetical protein
MEDILFIGNGLNRCENLGLSWQELLQQITKTFMINYDTNTINTLEFERFVFQILKQQKYPNPLTMIKKDVAKEFMMIVLPETKLLHKKFLSLPIKTIITTNYDYVLECLLDNKHTMEDVLVTKKNNTETKYSFNRYYQVKDKTIYHIHGEAKYPNTILLGYEHYVGTAQHAREAMKKPKDSYIKELLLNKKDTYWSDLFFTKNIHIIGFSFDYSELELWWLLTYRAHLYYTNTENISNIMKNRIIFYDIQPLGSSQNRKQLFEDFHIKYQLIEVENNDYKSAYMKIYTAIEQTLVKQKQPV